MTSKPFTTCLWFDNQGEEAAHAEKTRRVTAAMMTMKKFDIAELERAYAGDA